MQKNILIYLLLLPLLAFYAQNTDSLYYTYISHHQHSGIKNTNSIESTTQPVKCGFEIANTIRENFNLFSPDQQASLRKILERPNERQTSIVSPSGLFRIHYDLTGTHRPKYYDIPGLSDAEVTQMSVDSLAAAFDIAYEYEVNYLGYDSPIIGDDNLGGDNLYDVYIMNMGFYGETTTDGGNPTSYIKIDNDFIGSGFATHGIDAARATAAHELHHGIQLAYYGYFGSETEFYELTSTAMEEFVFDYVNDYYAYMPSYFNRPNRTLKNFNGYDLAAFYLFLQQKYAKEGDEMKGHQIIKRAWEVLAAVGSNVEALSTSLFEAGTSFKNTWNEFGQWCYFTGSHAKPGYYFEEAVYYPSIHPTASYDFVAPTKEFVFNTEPLSNNYIIFEINSENYRDTLVSIITNADTENGKASPYTNTEINYILTTNDEPGSYKIVNDYQSLLTTDIKDLFMEGNIFNNEVVKGGDLKREVLDYAFPQPFKYSENAALYIPVEPNSLGFAYLNVYSTGMELVYDGKADIIAGDKIVVQWDGRDNDDKKLPTGIYLYVTKSEDKIKKGKLVIYND